MTGPGLRHARAIALSALFLSTAAHALVFGGFAMPAPEEPAGGGGELAVPMLGNGFADLAAGQAVPVAPTEIAEVTPVQTIAPEPAPTLAPSEPARAVEAPAEMAPPAEPAAAEAAMTPVKVAAVVADQRIAPEPDAPPEASPRPEERKEKPVKAVARAVKPPVPAGNAQQDQVKGSATGAERGAAAVSAGKAKSPATSEGAAPSAAQYGAAVLRKIRATPVRKANGRGKAVVGFEIGPGGALAGVRVQRSSGSAEIDAAALEHIRRAAPFPPPPDGKARFSFEFVGRG